MDILFWWLFLGSLSLNILWIKLYAKIVDTATIVNCIRGSLIGFVLGPFTLIVYVIIFKKYKNIGWKIKH